MARKVALLTAAVVVLTAFGIGQAGATSPVPAGAISCTFSAGSMSVKPGLGATPNPKQEKIKSIILTAARVMLSV